MNNSHEQNFLTHYQTLLFSERDADVFQLCSVGRKRLAQMYKACVCLTNNFSTCYLYENNLMSYSKLVDDKSNVNNYADSIQTLLKCCPTECKQWKSSLSLSDYDGNSSKCNSYSVNDNDVEFLMQAWKSEENEAERFNNIPENSPNIEVPSTESRISRGQLNFPRLTSDTPVLTNQFIPTRKDIFSSSVKEKSLSNGINSSNCEKLKVNSGKNNFFSASRNLSEGNLQSFPLNKIPERCVQTPSSSFNASFSQSNPNYKTHSQFSSSTTNSIKSNNEVEIKPSNNKVALASFNTAREELIIQNQKKWGSRSGNNVGEGIGQRKCLGSVRRNVMNKFVPPVKSASGGESNGMMNHGASAGDVLEVEDERLKNIDPKMIEAIRNEIMDHGSPIHWDDIAGLQFAKTTIQEIVVWPMLRPEIFTGLRRPPKGILLFGPPGTGKTLIGKCIASQSHSTFFSISASSLTSKWIGDGEKMVRALFAVARCHQPAVVFIDEIDSLLSQRSDSEHECSRRIKTEFLVQLDGATTGEEERILVVGATNRPQELDEAARRRLVKRLYIPLPDCEARCQIVKRLMCKENSCLTGEEINEIAALTEGYSGADMRSLCEEASMGPIRSMSFTDIQNISANDVRPIAFEDFQSALKRVRASVSSCDLDVYLKWDKTYGSG